MHAAAAAERAWQEKEAARRAASEAACAKRASEKAAWAADERAKRARFDSRMEAERRDWANSLHVMARAGDGDSAW